MVIEIIVTVIDMYIHSINIPTDLYCVVLHSFFEFINTYPM